MDSDATAVFDKLKAAKFRNRERSPGGVQQATVVLTRRHMKILLDYLQGCPKHGVCERCAYDHIDALDAQERMKHPEGCAWHRNHKCDAPDSHRRQDPQK